MFEFDQATVDALLSNNELFRRLYDKHTSLKSQVMSANVGAIPMDDMTLGDLKKKKLMIKDQMAVMIKHHRQVQPSI